MTTFSSTHQAQLDSLLNRLEGVTSRLEGLQVRGVRKSSAKNAVTIPFSSPGEPVFRELQAESLLAADQQQIAVLHLLQTALPGQQRRRQLQITPVSLILQFPLW